MSMPVKYTCPACTAILKTPEPLPVGKQIKCPRCMRAFGAPAVTGAPVTAPAGGSVALKQAAVANNTAPAPPAGPKPTVVAGAARETKLAAAAKQTKVAASAQTTQLASPPAPPAAAPPKLRFPCPKCTGVLKVSTPPPPGKMLKCPRCNAVFPVPGAKPTTMMSVPTVGGAAKAPADPPVNAKAAAPKTLLAKPVAPGPVPVAKARPKTMLAKPAPAGPPPAPRPVRKTMLAKPTEAAAPPAAPKPKPKTMLAMPPAAAAPAKTPQPKPKTMLSVPAPAKTPTPGARTPAAAVKAPSAPAGPRFKYTCPGCKAVIASATAVPAGKAIKCPRCARTFSAPAAQAQKSPPTLIAPPTAAPTRADHAKPSPATVVAPAAAPKPVGPPAKSQSVRLTCPSCKAVLKLAGMPAPGASVKCPNCAKPLRFAKPASSPGAATKPTPSAVKKAADVAAAQPLAPAGRPRQRVGLAILVALCGLALLCAVAYSYLAGWWGNEIPESAWAPFAPPGGRCQVLMPGEPAEPVNAEPTMLGKGVVSAQKYTVKRKSEGAAFTLTWQDRQAEISGKMSFADIYDEVRRYLLDETSGWIQDENEIPVNGEPCKELRILTSDGGTVIARVFVVRGAPHDRVYVLLAADARVPPRPADAAKFLDSFKIERPPQPAREKGRIRTA